MFLLEVSVWSTASLGRTGLELLSLEAVSFGSFGRELLWRSAMTRNALETRRWLSRRSEQESEHMWGQIMMPCVGVLFCSDGDV